MSDQMMTAIRVATFGDPSVLQLQQLPIPTVADGQLLVHMHAAGINPVDTYIHTGTYAMKPALPYTPGNDGAGEVVSVGAGVDGFAPGDRVYVAGSLTGTYAQYAVCQADNVFPLSARLDYAQGAAIGVPHATAWRAVFQRGRAVAGETMLIHGATGSVGLAALQMATASGVSIIATGGTEAGRRLVAGQGAKAVFNHHDTDYVEKLAAEGGVDLIIEMLANVNLDRDMDMLAPGGRIVVVGNKGNIEINPRKLMQKEGQLLGLMLFAATEQEKRSIHAGLAAGFDKGVIMPYVGATFPLAKAAEAHRAMGQSGYPGKLVLLP